MKKSIVTKLVAAAATLTLTLSLAGCGSSSQAGGSTVSASGNTVIKVGANITPHAEILEQAVPILAEKGITLEIVKL